MSQYVVWYDSSEVGAPILNNAAGSLIGVLDACLVNGFNLKSVTSLVVAGGVATATCNSHGYSGKYSQDILLAGCNTPALNGRKQLTYVDTNTFRFDANGVADQTATGTITAKRDALGWVKRYAGTNKAMYKRSDPTATAMMLRVLDTTIAPATTTSARVFMVESATDVDTYTGQGPSQLKQPDGAYVNRGSNNATAKQWSLVGDGHAFYLMTQIGSVQLPSVGSGSAVFFFGDFKSFVNGDAYNTWLSGGGQRRRWRAMLHLPVWLLSRASRRFKLPGRITGGTDLFPVRRLCRTGGQWPGFICHSWERKFSPVPKHYRWGVCRIAGNESV